MEKIYRLYFRLDTTLHDESSALQNYMLATQYADSVYNEKQAMQWGMMQGQYETENARSKIEVLESENEVKEVRIQQSRTLLYGLGGFVVVIVLMAFLFIRQNKARAEHKSVVLEQKLLRLQMNPHFIFNSLADLQSYIWSKDPVTANDYLASFSKLLRLILENSRQEFVPVEK